MLFPLLPSRPSSPSLPEHPPERAAESQWKCLLTLSVAFKSVSSLSTIIPCGVLAPSKTFFVFVLQGEVGVGAAGPRGPRGLSGPKVGQEYHLSEEPVHFACFGDATCKLVPSEIQIQLFYPRFPLPVPLAEGKQPLSSSGQQCSLFLTSLRSFWSPSGKDPRETLWSCNQRPCFNLLRLWLFCE